MARRSQSPDNSATSPEPAEEPVEKWAGEPSPGGMGGSVTPPDPSYDPAKKPSPFLEVGSSGLAQYGGYIRDEYLTQLQGERGHRTYREMWDNDAIVGSIVFAIQMLLRKVEWRVEPPEAATVEDIVAEREAEKQKQIAIQHQANQQNLAMAQAGLAQNAMGGGKGAAGGKGGGPQGQPQTHPAPSLAGPAGDHPLHQGLPSNEPPGGQAAAPDEDSGLPGGGSSKVRKLLDRILNPWPGEGVSKASGGMVGGIHPESVNQNQPMDPETMEPMEFAQQTPMSPEERHQQELAVFVETALHDLDTPFADLISQIVTMIVFGFAYHETVYKKRKGPNPDDPRQGSRFDDGKIGWASLSSRAQETVHRWEFDEQGHPIGMWQLAPPKYQLRYIPLAKSLLFRTTAYKDNPEGRSLLRSAYRSWHFIRRLQEFEAIGFERNLNGLPLAGVPADYLTSTSTPEQIATVNEIKKIVRNVRVNEQNGIVWPRAYDENGNDLFTFELLSAGGGGTSSKSPDVDKSITRYEQRVAMTVLADFIMLGHDSVGARSLGETKSQMFTSALESFLNTIADVFNTFAIPRLMKINGEDPAMSPKLTFGKLTNISLTELAEIVKAMAGAGAALFPDVQLEDYMRDEAGLPPKASSDDL